MRKNKVRFFTGLIIAVILLATSVVGGYFIIDRTLVPRYFGKYGIHDLSELVNVVQTIYVVPDEKDIISNPFTDHDKNNAISKLEDAGFPTKKNGDIDYDAIAKNQYSLTPDENFVDNFVVLTDKEIASIVADIIDAGMLATDYPGLDAIDTLNIELKQIIVTPKEDTLIPNEKLFDPDLDSRSAEKTILSTTTDANIKLTMMLDTVSARRQIATNLNMPKFLVDWIIPDYLYATCQIDTYKNELGERVYENSTIAINSKTAKQSEILLSLLISFIFPDNTYSIESFSNELGALAIDGINMLGKMDFAIIGTTNGSQTGVKLTIS